MKLELDPTSVDVVNFIKLLCFLSGDIQEYVLLNEDLIPRLPSRYAQEDTTSILHDSFPFLRRGLKWDLVVKSVSDLPFVKISVVGVISRIFSLEPDFRSWLESRMRANPLEDAYFIIAVILLLHRYNSTPLAGRQRDVNFQAQQKECIGYALENLIRLCESLQETDLLMLKPETRLCCLLFYINWNGWSSDYNYMYVLDRQNYCPRSHTQLILQKLATSHIRDPLVLSIINAQTFLDTGYDKAYGWKYNYASFEVWHKLAEGLIESLDSLNANFSFITQPEPFAVDTLVALVQRIAQPSCYEIAPEGLMFEDMSKELRLEMFSAKQRIAEECYTFCTHLSGEYARFCVVRLARQLSRLYIVEDPMSPGPTVRPESKQILEKHFLDFMQLLPIRQAVGSFRHLLRIQVMYKDWSTYTSILSTIFRIRPCVIYNVNSNETSTIPGICLTPNDQRSIIRCKYFYMFEQIVEFPICDSEPIAAHHFLTMGRFPRQFEPGGAGTTLSRPADTGQSTQWTPIAKPFFILAKIYFESRDFLSAAMFASSYITLIRLNWARWNWGSPPEGPITLQKMEYTYSRCERDVEDMVRILTRSLMWLGLLSPLTNSTVAHYVQNTFHDRFPGEEVDPESPLWSWEIGEESDLNGKSKKVPWMPGPELSRPDDDDFSQDTYCLQIRGFFRLIDADESLKDARRRLARMTKEREDLVQRMLDAEGRLELPAEYVIARGISAISLP